MATTNGNTPEIPDVSDLELLSVERDGIVAVTKSKQKDVVPLEDYRAEVGTTGLHVFGGRLTQEFLLELQGLKGYRVYEEMRRNDPVIGGLLFAIEMAIRRVHWFGKANDDSSEQKKAVEFLEQNMDDMSHSWNDFISEALLFLPFGWAAFEQVYKERKGRQKDLSLPKSTLNAQPDYSKLQQPVLDDFVPSKFNDGKIGWRKFGYRPPDTLERWDMDPHGGIKGMWQRDIVAGRPPVFMPMEKMLLFRTRKERNNPEGYSVLRNSYKPYFFKKELEKFEAISLERTGAGIPVIKLPLGYTKKDLETAQRVVRRIRVDEQMGVTLPPNWELELLRPAGRAETQTYEMAIDRYANHILMSLLLTFIALGTRQVGSFALVKAQQDFFRLALVGWVSNMSDTINQFAVTRLFELNADSFSEDVVADPPKIMTTDVGEYDLDSISQFIQRAGATGFLTPDDHVEDYLRRIVGLPPLEDPEDPKLKREEMRMASLNMTPASDQTKPPEGPAQGEGPSGAGGAAAAKPKGGKQSQPAASGGSTTVTIKHPFGNVNAPPATVSKAVSKAVENDKILRQRYRELAIGGIKKTSESDLATIRGLIEEVLGEFESAARNPAAADGTEE